MKKCAHFPFELQAQRNGSETFPPTRKQRTIDVQTRRKTLYMELHNWYNHFDKRKQNMLLYNRFTSISVFVVHKMKAIVRAQSQIRQRGKRCIFCRRLTEMIE